MKKGISFPFPASLFNTTTAAKSARALTTPGAFQSINKLFIMYYALVTYYIHFSDHIRKSQKVICSKNKFTIEQLTDKETASKITGVTSKSIYTTFGYVEVVPPFLDYSDAISID